VSVHLRRPPSTLERILGRRRARAVRRRLGLLALGTGFDLLKPRSRWAPVVVAALFVLALAAGQGYARM